MKNQFFMVEGMSLNDLKSFLNQLHDQLKHELLAELENKRPLLSRKEACTMLGISNPTIISLTGSSIPGYRIQGQVKYKYEEIENYIEQSRINKLKK
ncbi:MAG: helix-turn-helix domain-containing protein [Flavobacteriales bacterium]|nr:helix-turn-helix domain-containing protein [Flavobacteriales bacterium]